MNWKEIKQEDYKSDIFEKVICDNCKEEIKEGDVYYDVDNTFLCEVCINDCKRYA